MILPPSLRPGDRVALVAPAGPVEEPTIERALDRCHALGLQPVTGGAIRARNGYLAGRDEERAADLAWAFGAHDIAAVWALRGGYGTLRTLEHVDISAVWHRPKAFIGFSDNTIIHLALRKLGIVSFHGPHAGYEHFPAATEAAFRAVLMRDGPAGLLPAYEHSGVDVIRSGSATGPLIGGNLALLAASCGTPYQPDTRGSILFIEEVGESLYRIDRLLMQLRLAGLLDGVTAVALGEFLGVVEQEGAAARVGGPGLVDLLGELLEPLGVPVVLGLPFGHGRENWTLPLGVRARLDADAGTLELLEPATTQGRVS